MPKSVDKILDALSLLLEGFTEIKGDPDEDEYDEDEDYEDYEDDHSEGDFEIESDLVTQFRMAIEGVLDNEDYSTEEVASLIAHLSEAIQEIDPDVFEQDEEETLSSDDESDEDLDMDSYDEDDDLEDDDLDDDDYDDEDDEDF